MSFSLLGTFLTLFICIHEALGNTKARYLCYIRNVTSINSVSLISEIEQTGLTVNFYSLRTDRFIVKNCSRSNFNYFPRYFLNVILKSEIFFYLPFPLF